MLNRYPTYGVYQPSGEEELHKIVVPPNSPENISMQIIHPLDVGYMAYDWIEMHDPSMQPCVREVIENVSYVSFNRFMGELGSSASNAISQLGTVYKGVFDVRSDVVVMVEGTKSNKWVAELAFHYFKFIPKAFFRLGDKDAWNFFAYMSQANPMEFEQLQNAFFNKTIVLFDDASLSGEQLSGHVQGICRVCSVFALSIRAICVIAPFITQVAEERINQTFLGCRPLGSEIVIASHVDVKTIADLSSATAQAINLAWYKAGSPDLRSLGLTWFNHKVPNYRSFPKPLARASVYSSSGSITKKFSGEFIPSVIPPYKRAPGTS